MEIAPHTIIGKYEVVALLGAGAMASVFEVRHTQLGATYALKLLDRTSRRTRDRLLQEGRVQATLQHPNIVAVSDVVEYEGQPGLVMEYVNGPNLADYLAAEHPLPLSLIDQLARAIIKGVRAAHRANHVHRDLKPANILLQQLDDELIPKIADFGLVKVLGEPGDEGLTRTKTGAVLGSPAYMSPEQTRSSKHVDVRADIWALGTVLYQLVCGELAFPDNDLVTLFSKVRAGSYVPVERRRADLPERMRLAIAHCLIPSAEDRVQDCDTLLAIWQGSQVPLAVSSSTDTVSEFLRDPSLQDSSDVDQLVNSDVNARFTRETSPSTDPAASAGTLGDDLRTASVDADSGRVHTNTLAATGPLAAFGVVLGGGLAVLLVLGLAGGGLWLAMPLFAEPKTPTMVTAPVAPAALATPSAQPATSDPVGPEVAETAELPVARPPSQPSEKLPAADHAGRPAKREPVGPTPSTPRAPEETTTSIDAETATPERSPSEAMALAHFSASGNAEKVWLVRGGTYHEPGEVEPGNYTVAARFPGLPVRPIEGLVVSLTADQRLRLDCVAAFRTCKTLH